MHPFIYSVEVLFRGESAMIYRKRIDGGPDWRPELNESSGEAN